MCDLIIRKGDQELEVTLTPSCYLQGKSLLERERLEELLGGITGIEIKHDKSNQYDDLAIAVYSNGIAIGYVQKRFPTVNRTSEIEGYMFEDAKFITTLS